MEGQSCVDPSGGGGHDRQHEVHACSEAQLSSHRDGAEYLPGHLESAHFSRLGGGGSAAVQTGSYTFWQVMCLSTLSFLLLLELQDPLHQWM